VRRDIEEAKQMIETESCGLDDVGHQAGDEGPDLLSSTV